MEIFEFGEIDRGRYAAQCVGTNVMTSAIIDLAVPATVDVVDDDILTKANVVTEINATVKGMPKPEIAWYKVSITIA